MEASVDKGQRVAKYGALNFGKQRANEWRVLNRHPRH